MHGRVTLVEDNVVIRTALHKYLQTMDPELEVSEAEDGVQAVQLAALTRPDVVLMDIMLPTMTGVEAAYQIRAMSPDTRLIFITGYNESWMRDKAAELGAFGFLLKGRELSEMLDVVHNALQTEPPPPLPVGRQTSEQPEAQRFAEGELPTANESPHPLSEREERVLELVEEGKKDLEIADRLHITHNTVRTHLRRIYEKLDVHNRTQAVVRSRGFRRR